MIPTFRITSNKTRIETDRLNWWYFVAFTFRITSNKTRIETDAGGLPGVWKKDFQNNIQQNKDWNEKEELLRFQNFLLSE